MLSLATLPSLTMSYAHAACAGRRASAVRASAAELGLREPDVLLEARRDVADCEVFGCSIDEMREIHERLMAARSDSVPDGYGVVAELAQQLRRLQRDVGEEAPARRAAVRTRKK